MSDCRFGVSPVNYPDPDPDCVFYGESLGAEFWSGVVEWNQILEWQK